MIRKATNKDIPRIVELSIEARSKDPYKKLVISRKKIVEMSRLCISSSQHFAWVAQENGVVGGVIMALVHECAVYERQQASIFELYSQIPGDGINLVRECLKWCRGRLAIKIISLILEHEYDPGFGKLLEDLGLTQVLPNYIEIR